LYFSNLKKELMDEVASSRLPLRHLIIMTVSIFTMEVFVMAMMHRYLAVPHRVAEVIDALMLVLLLSPVLYFFLFRPLLHQIRVRAAAERTLQAERDKLKGILDAMDDGVCIISNGHTVAYVNPALEQRRGAAGGNECFRYLYDRSEPCLACAGGSAPGQRPVRSERTSSNRVYSTFETPLRNADGGVSKLEIIHDITAQKAVEEALRLSKGELQELSAELHSAQETERRRISAELHDQLGQDLTLLKLRLTALRQTAPADRTAFSRDCAAALGGLDAALENVRRIARDLSPSVLEDIGLTAALRTMAEQYARDYRVALDLGADIDRLFSREDALVIYRVFQEAFTNIVKHAEAGKIHCSARTENGFVVFGVEDDGKGFSSCEVKGKAPERTGLGFKSMRQRAQMLGGTLSIESRPGQGTTVRFRIPVAEEGRP
jgi:signal transduction histidine kinase